MTWRDQVWHIMRKDVRQHRLALALHVAVVLMATIATIVVGATPMTWVLPFTTTCLATVFIVQGDPLSARAAHWATQPLHATALVGAKLLLAVALVGLPALLGQWLALRASGAGVQHSLELLGPSAWFMVFAVLVVMTWAVVTVRLSSFVLQAFVVYLFMISWSVFTSGRQVDDATIRNAILAPWITALLIAGGVIAALVAWYRSRATGWRSLVGANALVLTSMVACESVMDPRPIARDVGPASDVHVVLQAQVLGSGQGLQLRCRVAGAGPNDHVRIDYDSITVTFGNGDRRRFLLGPPSDPPRRHRFSVLEPFPVQDSGLKWLGESPLRSSCANRAQMDAPAQVLASGVRQVEMTGMLEVHRLTTSMVVPVRPDEAVPVHDGYVRFDSARFDPIRLFFTQRALIRSRSAFTAFENHALVNPSRSEAVLMPGSTSASGAPLVLPGATLLNGSMSLATWQGHGQPVVDARWLADAHVVFVRRIPVGRSRYVARAVPE